jgi:hypothetical protein
MSEWGTFSFEKGYIAAVFYFLSEIESFFGKATEIKLEAVPRAESRGGYFRKREKVLVYNKSTLAPQCLKRHNVIFPAAVRYAHMFRLLTDFYRKVELDNYDIYKFAYN